MNTTLGSGFEVLLVEDNPNDARLIRRHLTESTSSLLPGSVDFHHAESLEAGVETAEDHAVDLLLLDLGLPESEGTDTYDRAQERLPGVPVVVLTNLDDDQAAVELLNEGAQDYLNKRSLNRRNLIKSIRYAVERWERQRELEQYERIVETMDDAALIVDRDWNIVYADSYTQEQADLTMAHIRGTPTMEVAKNFFTSQEAVDHYETALEDVFEGDGETDPHRFEVPLELPDGTEIQEYQLSPIERGGEVVAAVVVARDVTERKEREEKLQTTSEQLEVLNRILRHDIQNDIQTIQLWVEKLQRDIPDKGGDDLQRVFETSKHVEELTENSRALIKAVIQEELETEPVRLDDIVQGEFQSARSRYPDAEFTVEEPLPETVVSANETLSSVVRNLLNNALQHNRGQVEVSGRVEQRDGSARLCVSDNGPGVPDDQKQDIFGKGSKGLESEGTGIGLYLVNQLVQSYGGDVWVEDGDHDAPPGSQDDPEGATFVVELPVAN
jgi:PAS domain S-box-containing protein